MLLNSLKQTVVTLASSAGVLGTVQSAAQAVLQSGWSVLLPTAEERARALSALLPCTGELLLGEELCTDENVGRDVGGHLIHTAKNKHPTKQNKPLLFSVSGNEVNISPGRRFMIDLLVGSLMADGGLESALNAAITAEIQVWR